MKDIMQTVFNRAKAFWDHITINQRIIIGATAVVVVAAFIGMVIWLNRPTYDVLFTKLGIEDANRVVKVLEAQQEPYQLVGDGQTIMVQSDRVQHLRVSMAGENVITGQGIGFEMFDTVKFGDTDYVQKINYRRALEGELARTIMQFPNVEGARVHLVIPNRSLFIEEQQKPSASVILKVTKEGKVETKDIIGIINLVTMSVPGLTRETISVADSTTGKVLYEPEQENSVSGLTQTQREHKMMVQRDYERRIEELLSPVMGSGRVIAKVNVDLDFSQKTIRRELFDPEKTVVRSEQRSEESTQGSGNINAGVPDPNFRGDGFTGSASNQNSNRETRTTNFEINKEEYNIVPSVGGVDRITVAVIVDGTYEKGADGKMQFVPKNDEDITRIRQLVSSAVGFDSARGDVIQVSSVSFGAPEEAAPESLDAVISDYAVRFGKPLLNTMLVFLFLILVVRPVVLALIRPKVEGKMLEGLEGLPQLEDRLALEEVDEETLAATVVLDKIEDIKAHALQLSEQNMEQALGILKSWLKESPAAAGASVPAKA